ncbi:MAG: hypothetical protein MJ236_00825 [Clostridia bacterium]|nr:hypothetical protein [Clostridia bacterium]
MRGKTNVAIGGGGEVFGDVVEFIADGTVQKGDFVNIAYDTVSKQVGYTSTTHGINILPLSNEYSVAKICPNMGSSERLLNRISIIDNQLNERATYVGNICYSNMDNLLVFGGYIFLVIQTGDDQAIILKRLETNEDYTDLIEKQSVTILAYERGYTHVLQSIYAISSQKAIIKYSSKYSSTTYYYRTITLNGDGSVTISSAITLSSSSVVIKYFGQSYQIDDTYSSEIYGNSVRKFEIDNYESTVSSRTLDVSIDYSCRLYENVIVYTSGKSITLFNLETMEKLSQVDVSLGTICGISRYDENCFVLFTNSYTILYMYDGENIFEKNKIKIGAYNKRYATRQNDDLIEIANVSGSSYTNLNLSKLYVDENYNFSSEARNKVKKHDNLNQPIGFAKTMAQNGEIVEVYVPN